MPPPNPPIWSARRSPSLDYDTDVGSVLSPTQHAQPSLLELEDLLEDLKPKKQVEAPVLEEPPPENSPESQHLPNQLPVAGEVIGGAYLVEGELGSGAMGVVLLAVDQQLKRKVAIKLIQSSLFAKHFQDRFLQEARAMAEVNHPNVLVIHAFGEHRRAPYFVTEFVSGTTLDRVIAECRRGIEVDMALRIMDEICAGVGRCTLRESFTEI